MFTETFALKCLRLSHVLFIFVSPFSLEPILMFYSSRAEYISTVFKSLHFLTNTVDVFIAFFHKICCSGAYERIQFDKAATAI